MSITGYVINGGKKAEFYSVTIGSTQIVLASTSAKYVCESQITSDGAKDDTGVITWTIEQVQADKDFFDFIDEAAPPTASTSTSEELTLENGTVISAQQTGGTKYALLVRGALVESGTHAGKRLSWGGLVQVQKSSGSVNFAGTAYVKPTLVAVASSLTADLVLPSAAMTSYMTTAASVTILKTTHPYGKVTVA